MKFWCGSDFAGATVPICCTRRSAISQVFVNPWKWELQTRSTHFTYLQDGHKKTNAHASNHIFDFVAKSAGLVHQWIWICGFNENVRFDRHFEFSLINPFFNVTALRLRHTHMLRSKIPNFLFKFDIRNSMGMVSKGQFSKFYKNQDTDLTRMTFIVFSVEIDCWWSKKAIGGANFISRTCELLICLVGISVSKGHVSLGCSWLRNHWNLIADLTFVIPTQFSSYSRLEVGRVNG